MTDETSDIDIDFARGAANAAATSAIDRYELAISASRRATSRYSYYVAFNDVIRAARAARDALDAAYAAAEEVRK